MSGTSLDGVDAALIKTDGQVIGEIGPSLTLPYPLEFQQKLRKAIADFPDYNPDTMQELTEFHVLASRSLIRTSGIQPDYIGFHGQTLFHRPKTESQPAYTYQAGDAQYLVNALQIPVVYDFRSNDIQNGGEGAPLVPIYHQALSRHLEKPLAVVNIGGVANTTLLYEDGSISAGDTGPGCALVNDWIFSKTGQPFDKDGDIARQGIVKRQKLAKWLEYDFFKRPFPKSLDRDTFKRFLLDCQDLSLEDGAATLCALTAKAIYSKIKNCKKIILTGGGRHNKTLAHQIRGGFLQQVLTPEDISWNGDSIEAEAFAFLAIRSVRGLPITFPMTTGNQGPLSGLPGGKVVLPDPQKR